MVRAIGGYSFLCMTNLAAICKAVKDDVMFILFISCSRLVAGNLIVSVAVLVWQASLHCSWLERVTVTCKTVKTARSVILRPDITPVISLFVFTAGNGSCHCLCLLSPQKRKHFGVVSLRLHHFLNSDSHESLTRVGVTFAMAWVGIRRVKYSFSSITSLYISISCFQLLDSHLCSSN